MFIKDFGILILMKRDTINITEKNRRLILEPFVTSPDDTIYAIKNMPPEVFGAFGSYFSRNPLDFRVHLVKSIRGTIDGEVIELENKTLLPESYHWLLNKDYREPSDAIREGIEQSQHFFRKWYGKYSHKSIANTVWIPMVANDVSQLFARELAYDQLAFFIEQSTRFVKMDVNNLFQDADIIKSGYRGIYLSTLETLAGAYLRLTDLALEENKRELPFEKWREMQKENKWEKEMMAKYEREMKGKTLDVTRFLLPQATRTNIAWILDARSIEFDIAAWKGHPLQELKEDARLIEKHAGQIAPSLLKYTKRNEYYADNLNGYLGHLRAEPGKGFEKGVDIISCEENALEKAIAHILKRHNCGGTFRQRFEEVQKMSFCEKINVLERVVMGRGEHDEWVEMDEEFDLVKIAFEIRTDVGATRDWRRHQKWDRGESLYSLDNGFHRPYMIDNISKEAVSIFNNAMEVAYEAETLIRRDFPYQAQYVIPMAANHAITFSGGLDQLQYMLWTRSTPQGNFSYRKDAFNVAEAVLKIHPWLLGYKNYPEGRKFEDVYNNAPLKNLFRLQMGETKLHE